MSMRLCILALASVFPVIDCASSLAATPQLIGPLPCFRASDSPFQHVAFDYFILRDMESGPLDTTTVSVSGGSVYGPGGLTDSVDGDDGIVDGHGTNGHSFFSGSGPTGILFRFKRSVLGRWPTHAGIVWTDGNNAIVFEAFDTTGASVGSISGSHADGDNYGGSSEDRFYGVIHGGGIHSILIRSGIPSAGGGIEVDHLQ